MIPLVPLQLSLAVTPLSTSFPTRRSSDLALALVGAGQLTLGTVASVTVKVVVQVALLPASSVAVTVIVFVPWATSVSAVGDWIRMVPLVLLELSLAVTPPSTSGTAAWQVP